MKVQTKVDVIDLLLHRQGLTNKAALGRLFEVERQHINNWKKRNRIPQEHLRRAIELGLELDDLVPKKPVGAKNSCVPMKDVINDPTHYIEIARSGITVEVTVRGKTVAKIIGASVAA